ncbi:unnamed protein product [Parnassius mnemosyne]|uniref:Uncharacterized protein n=1 Tax=Parnassius mnemosyne TaxID=213953 RepID=A0AAV1L7N4_9NEOP
MLKTTETNYFEDKWYERKMFRLVYIEIKTWNLLFLLSLLALVMARPQEFEDEEHDDGHSIDNRRGDVSRVQIKVYRGPTKHDGYAPWGFWVKQPSDDQ